MAENEMQKNAWKTERSRLLPDVRIGYTNQSLTGIVYDGRISSTSDRFQFVNAGISIPIFYQSQHAKNKIAKASWEKSIAQLNFEKDKNALEKQRLQAICKEEKILLLKYKNSILPEMKLALSSSIQQLEKGSITYAEWAMYINQVISTYDVYQGLYMQSLQDYTELLIVNSEL
jgi:cobalt-zinc-cadmium resistance protein CzcA